jgi:hypothetical protein
MLVRSTRVPTKRVWVDFMGKMIDDWDSFENSRLTKALLCFTFNRYVVSTALIICKPLLGGTPNFRSKLYFRIHKNWRQM